MCVNMVYACVVCMHMYVQVRVSTQACGGQKRMSGSFSTILNLISLEQHLSLNLERGWWPSGPQNPLFPQCPQLTVLGQQAWCVATRGFLHGAGIQVLVVVQVLLATDSCFQSHLYSL